MLVLSRKNGEQILIPEHGILITVVEAHGGRVRLGFTAPKEVKIIRRELQGRPSGIKERRSNLQRTLALRRVNGGC